MLSLDKGIRTKTFLICLLSIVFLFSIKQNGFIKEKLDNFSSILLRKLMDDAKYYEICNGTDAEFPEKYNNYFLSPIPVVEPDIYQQAMIELIRDSAYSDWNYYKNYLPRIKFYIISLFLIIFIIISWIFYGCFHFCPKCIFKKNVPKLFTCNKLYIVLAIINFLIVIFITILLLLFLTPLTQSFNGTGCSVFKVIRHIIYGTNEDYPKNGYRGIDRIRTRIAFLIEVRAKIKSFESNLSSGTKTCEKHKTDVLYKIPCRIIELANEASSMTKINFDEEVELLSDLVDTCDAIENEYLDYVYEYIHDYVNKYITIFGQIFCILTIIFSFLNIIFICINKIKKTKSFKIIYNIIWNISMLLILIMLILSCAMGAVGAVGSDSVIVAQYFVSEKNLKSGNESIIIDCEENNKTCICLNRCLNGNGRIAIPEEISVEELDKKKEEFEGLIKDLNEDMEKIFEFGIGVKQIKEAFQNITRTTMEVFTFYTDIVDVDKDICFFVKSDFEILIDEIGHVGKRAFILSFLFYFIFCLLGISVLFGVLGTFDYQIENIEINNNSTEIELGINDNQNDNNDNPD